MRKVILLILIVCGLSAPLLPRASQSEAPAQSAQELYQRGLVQEHAVGNLKEAVALYRQAAQEAGKDRALAARALVRAGSSLEKMGLPEAAQLYTEVMRTYPEQQEQARQAQTRLVALRRPLRAAPQTTTGSSRTDVSAVISPIFESYCISCHNQSSRIAGTQLDTINTKNVGDDTATWERILQRMRARRDPPSGRPRPDEGVYTSAISTLELALDQAYPENSSLNTAPRVTDVELAARTATFLWSGAPDAALLTAAQQGRLRDPAVLEQQVRRMLRDPKASNLVSNFFEPWSSLDGLDKVAANPGLTQAFATETRLFLNDQIREDHGALELWTANATFLNETLARYYGIPNVSGNDFRRVTLADNTRAGLMGQGSFLTVSSIADRTSPTMRGRMLLTMFLGIAAPNPPPNVPPMKSVKPESRTMRARVDEHKTNPACVNCHTSFDPMGLALENFDNLGRWRTTEGSVPIDPSGTFVDGSKFNGPAELRAGLLKYRDAYYSSITKTLLAYALGRGARAWPIYDYEMPSVRSIVRAAAPNDYRWSSIVLGIVKSTPFQMKKIVP